MNHEHWMDGSLGYVRYLGLAVCVNLGVGEPHRASVLNIAFDTSCRIVTMLSSRGVPCDALVIDEQPKSFATGLSVSGLSRALSLSSCRFHGANH